MKPSNPAQKFRFVLALFGGLLAFLNAAYALAEPEEVGHFTFVKGRVDVTPAGGEARDVKQGDALHRGDTIRTKRRAMAQVALDNDSVLNIAEESSLAIDSVSSDVGRDGSSIRALRGMVRTLVPKSAAADSRFEIKTPTAVAAVRGTEWITKVGVDTTDFWVLGGIVAISNIDPNVAGQVLVHANHATRVATGEPPLPPFAFSDSELMPLLKNLSPDESGGPPDGNPLSPLDSLLPAIARSADPLDLVSGAELPAERLARPNSIRAYRAGSPSMTGENPAHEEPSGTPATPPITESHAEITSTAAPVDVAIEFQ
jgi:hypothetical protein